MKSYKDLQNEARESVKPRMIHQSIDGNKRYTLDFGERRRVKNTCNDLGIRNKKKHKLRQQRKAIAATKEYYGDKADKEILDHAKSVVRHELFKQHKEAKG